MPRKRSKKKSTNFNEYLPWIIVGALVLAFIVMGAGPTGKFTVTEAPRVAEAPGMFLGFPESNCREALTFFFPEVTSTPLTLDTCQSNSDCPSVASEAANCCAGPVALTFPEALPLFVVVGANAPTSHVIFAGNYIRNIAGTIARIRLDTEITRGTGSNLVLIGGSDVNMVSAAVLGENFPTDPWSSSLSMQGSQNLFINIDGDGDNAIILIPEQQRICGAAKNVCMNENIANQINSWTADDVAFRAAATFCSEDKDDDGYLPEDAQIFNTMKRISFDFDKDMINRMIFDCDDNDPSTNNGIYVRSIWNFIVSSSSKEILLEVSYNCSASDTVRDVPNFNQPEGQPEVPPEEIIFPEEQPPEYSEDQGEGSIQATFE